MRGALALVTTLCSFLGQEVAGQSIDPGTTRKIERSIRDYMAAGRVPGMSIAVGVGNRLVWRQGFGWADLENRVPVDTATAFPMASVTKLLTATAVLQLAEQGRLDLDQPVDRHCPAFPAKPWPIAPRQLLTHQAGIRPSRGSDVFNRDYFATVVAAVDRFANDSLVAEPGTAVTYTNEGYVLLACVVEGASGRSYDDYLGDRILRPAGMAHTFRDDRYRVMPKVSRSYLVRTATNTEAWRGLWTAAHLAGTAIDTPAVADPVDLSHFPGAGNYRSTPSDVVRFVIGLGRGTLLGAPVSASLFRDAPLLGAGKPTGRTDGGWVVDTSRGEPSFRVVGSVWTGSFAVWTLPDRGVTIALASNVQFNQPVELMGRILDLLIASRRRSDSAPER